MEKIGESPRASDPGDDVDARTVFVRKLPFSLTDSQLEEIFSEIGPVRHCFLVKKRGSDEHRGFGFVQFSVTEDALRAVEEKDCALVQGRKIKVEVARRRAPLDVRRPKTDSSNSKSKAADEKQPVEHDDHELDSKKRKSSAFRESPEGEDDTASLPQGSIKEPKEIVNKAKAGGRYKIKDISDQSRKGDGSHGSARQRSARTVVVGGLASTEMLDAVLAEAKKAGPIESIQKTMSEIELSSRGLIRDGCKPRAAAVVFVSVKAARKAVAILHKKSILDGVVWARQLGGEGSKLKQLRLIVRNLPFNVSEATLRDIFSPAGFLWEVTVPRKPDGTGKGFAFVGFTSKGDAEKGIKVVNGALIAKRPVAVDWAVGKKQFDAAVNSNTDKPAAASVIIEDESESTASESDSSDDEDGGGNDSMPEKDEGITTINELSRSEKQGISTRKRPTSDDLEANEELISKEEFSSEGSEDYEEPKSSSMRVSKHGHDPLLDMNRTEEIDMVKKIMTKVVTSADNDSAHSDDGSERISDIEGSPKLSSAVPESRTLGKKISSKVAAAEVEDVGTEPIHIGDDEGKAKLNRTVFIRNLPRDMKVPALRKLFSEFGKIQSFRLVVCPVTKRSKGNAFLEYVKDEAAQAAVARAAKSGPDEVGLTLMGRAVTVSMAVDKNSARKMAKETFHKQVQEDKRNLALAKEGNILAGTPASDGVSKKDLAKRQQLLHEKSTKLRSPNFHVSRTRLIVHNIPKNLTQKEVKKLFIDAVKSHASKQNPVVKQVKILEDKLSQASRGAAFVEFLEHQHALVALRVLNNNPATFGSESRPIVEFAIENSLILRKRAASALQAKNKEVRSAPKREVVRADKRTNADNGPKRKRHSDEDVARADKRTNGDKGPKRTRHSDVDIERADKGSNADKGPKRTRHSDQDVERVDKRSNADKGPKRKRHNDGDAAVLHADTHAGGRENNFQGKKMRQQGKSKTPAVPGKSTPSMQTEVNGKGRNRGRRKDAEDRLDQLVTEYRRKYFSNENQVTTSRVGKPESADLRRWFE